MADSITPPSKDRLLRGKTNWTTWKPDFDREARAHDVLGLLTGDDKILKQPEFKDYSTQIDRSSARLSTDADKAQPEKDAKPHVDAANNALKYQIDLENFKTNKKSLKTALKLLNAYISEGIQIEIEDCDNAKAAYDLIKTKYGVSDERARVDLLTDMAKLKISDCEDITDYLNKLRRLKNCLTRVKHTMSDDEFATAILRGLEGQQWNGFKQRWDDIRAWQLDEKPDSTPSIDFLEGRLHQAETDKKRRDEEKKMQEKNKKNTNTNTSTRGGTGRSSSNNGRASREDKSHLKCDHCSVVGHIDEDCWKLHPEKIPKAVKEKMLAAKNKDKSDKSDKDNKASNDNKLGALSVADIDEYLTKLAKARSLGTHISTSSPVGTLTDSITQQRDLEVSGGSQLGESGGDCDTGNERYPHASKAIQAFMAGRFTSSDTWLADSAANMHIVNDTKWFKTFHLLDADINTADNSAVLEVKGGGTVEAVMKDADGQMTKLSLSDVAYAPKGCCNLLSVGMLAKKAGIRGRFDDNNMILSTAEGADVGYAKFHNGLYHISIDEITKPTDPFASGEVIAAVVDFDDPVWRMHRRLGHLGLQSMLNLKKFSTGINLTEKQIKAKLRVVCPVCATTKALVKIPRDPAKRQAKKPGQVMHADTWGPYPIEGYDGTHFFLLITDDYTRYTWCTPFSDKRDLPETFRALHKQIARTHKITIRKYRFDNEFSNGPIGRWCTKHGITMEPSEPYAHYMNGIAERNMRTVRERAAPMIQETTLSGQISKIVSEKGTELLRVASIPENLWPEAFKHAVWLKNRSPARALKKKEHKTPYEALYKEQPSFERERIWGSRAYSAYPLEDRDTAEFTKLHNPRGWIGYFVGCESESVYHIYDPKEHKVKRKGVAEIDDGEGLDDPQDGPSLQDRTPLPQIEISDDEVVSGATDGSDTEQEQSDEDQPSPPPSEDESVRGSEVPSDVDKEGSTSATGRIRTSTRRTRSDRYRCSVGRRRFC